MRRNAETAKHGPGVFCTTGSITREDPVANGKPFAAGSLLQNDRQINYWVTPLLNYAQAKLMNNVISELRNYVRAEYRNYATQQKLTY